MIHSFIYKLYPQVISICDDKAFDIDGNLVPYDLTLIEAEQAKQLEKDTALAYLASTDFMMTADYDKDTTEVKVLRAAARAVIRGEA